MEYFVFSIVFLAIVTALYIRMVSGHIATTTASLMPLHYLFFFFVFAPLIHVLTGTYISDFATDAKRPVLLANMALFNSLGLLLAIASFRAVRFRQTKISVALSPKILRNVAFVSFLVALSIALYTAVSTNFGNTIRFDPSGEAYGILYFMMFESAPILFAWLVVAHYKVSKRKISVAGFVVVVLLICLISVVFCGMRGSRVAVVVQILSSLIILHLALRRVDAGLLALVFVSAIPFFFLFGIYKAGGSDALADFFERGYVSAEVSRTLDPSRILVGDFGRSDVQAVVLDRVMSGEYSPAFTGETYLHAFSLVLPPNWRPDFRDKRKMGTEVQFGTSRMGEIDGRPVFSSRIYGGTGEGMLNFGILGGLAFFAVFGYFHALSVNFAERISAGALVLISPMPILIPIYLLFYDLDNIVFQFIRTWLVPLLLLTLASYLSSFTWKRIPWHRALY